MIRELLGILCDAESLAAADTYAGYCIDMVAAAQNLPGACPIWLTLSTNVAADYANADETYEFQLRKGTGTDGTDINAGAEVIISTGTMNGNNARLDAAGDMILRCAIPYEMSKARYWQLYYNQSGTTPSITIDASLTPWPARTDFNIQVTDSNVGVP